MSRTSEITKVAMFVEVGGKAYAVSLPDEQKLMLCNMAATLSDTGALPLFELPDGFSFTKLGQLKVEEVSTRKPLPTNKPITAKDLLSRKW
jgi:hypothetical protein